ncbi:adenylate kinase [Nakamurella sp. YIM 132087]|uniref:Adenylate kinase n=1 Tax=Nakamurella alba TaxID=2665158 RepID=A0A7K1FNJ9_9ACTN|nr:adenylate kinase [Nakamurella alba]MTD15741.1 adenylate kinase [Nakamurella alba]
MRLLIFGPQGVGKGTQAQLLAPHFGVPHISTGDLFRENIAAGTHLGKQAQAALTAGELVSDGITQAMLADRLREDDARNGFILDGFPRTPEQADWLDAMLIGGAPVDAAIVLTAPYEVLVERALVRGRSDDTTEAIERRLAIYRERTQPLLSFYGSVVETVDADQPVQLVHQDILARVSERTGVL